VHHPRRSEPVVDPVGGENPHPLHERFLHEGIRIDVGEIRFGESHD
jgi:hypothetical protein